MELGIVGLGRMGGSLALNARDRGIKVVGKDIRARPDLAEKGVIVVTNYSTFATELRTPRIIYLSLPAGPIVDKVLGELIPFLSKGDVVMDGGNSFFRDSVRREKELAEKGFHFLDCGTSGGVEGARKGACFMVGGKIEGIMIAESILKTLAANGGYLHTGEPGSGHLVKLIHNGIEFGMLQAIGEGVALMRGSDYDLDLEKIFANWSHGSVIRSWLIELMEKGLKEKKIDEVPSYVEDTGEVNWLLHEAVEKEIPIPVITQSVMELFRSREEKNDAARAVALMRHGFGEHPFGMDEYVAKERKTGRIGKF